MKKIPLIILSAFIGLAAKAQTFCAFPSRKVVPVFESATSYTPVTYLSSVDGTDICYDCIIVENSPLRFKVQYFIPVCDADQEVWINKSDLIGTIMGTPDGKGGFYVYNNYNDTIGQHINSLTVTAHPLDVHFDYDEQNRLRQFTKVIFEYNGKVIIGWVRRFCGNQYQSCN